MSRITPAVAFLLVVMVSNVFGATIYGTAAPVGSGSRTEGDQIVTGASYATDDQTFTVAWDISFNPGTSIYSYAYTFSGFTAPDISHFILDLTDNCTDPANQGQCIFNVASSGGTTPFRCRACRKRFYARLAVHPHTTAQLPPQDDRRARVE